jgi:Flp pilus assembly protein TadG
MEMAMSAILRRILREERGTAVMEFALVAPVFLATLLGMAGYGGYFWRAHSIQQIANDAARASLSGLTSTERETLAIAAVTSEFASMGGIDASRTSTSVTQTSDTITVAVNYDGTRDGFLNLSLVPLPSKLIKRVAAVRMGGL